MKVNKKLLAVFLLLAGVCQASGRLSSALNKEKRAHLDNVDAIKQEYKNKMSPIDLF